MSFSLSFSPRTYIYIFRRWYMVSTFFAVSSSGPQVKTPPLSSPPQLLVSLSLSLSRPLFLSLSLSPSPSLPPFSTRHCDPEPWLFINHTAVSMTDWVTDGGREVLCVYTYIAFASSDADILHENLSRFNGIVDSIRPAPPFYQSFSIHPPWENLLSQFPFHVPFRKLL